MREKIGAETFIKSFSKQIILDHNLRIDYMGAKSEGRDIIIRFKDNLDYEIDKFITGNDLGGAKWLLMNKFITNIKYSNEIEYFDTGDDILHTYHDLTLTLSESYCKDLDEKRKIFALFTEHLNLVPATPELLLDGYSMMAKAKRILKYYLIDRCGSDRYDVLYTDNCDSDGNKIIIISISNYDYDIPVERAKDIAKHMLDTQEISYLISAYKLDSTIAADENNIYVLLKGKIKEVMDDSYEYISKKHIYK